METGKTEQIYHAQLLALRLLSISSHRSCSMKERCSLKKISQDSQENTCVGVSFLLKLQA